jgi:uncharacterized membrane protein
MGGELRSFWECSSARGAEIVAMRVLVALGCFAIGVVALCAVFAIVLFLPETWANRLTEPEDLTLTLLWLLVGLVVFAGASIGGVMLLRAKSAQGVGDREGQGEEESPHRPDSVAAGESGP